MRCTAAGRCRPCCYCYDTAVEKAAQLSSRYEVSIFFSFVLGFHLKYDILEPHSCANYAHLVAVVVAPCTSTGMDFVVSRKLN